MGYSIEIILKAEKEFLKLPEAIQRQIRRQILSLDLVFDLHPVP